VPAIGLIAAAAGACLLGWAIHRRLGGGRLGATQDLTVVAALLLAAGGLFFTWRWHDRNRRRTAELNLASEALRERAEILAALNDAVVATDADGRVVAWSLPAARIYGWSEAEALGKRASELLRTEYPPGQGRAWMHAELARSGRVVCQVRQARRDGTWVDVEATVVERRGPGGEVVGWVSVNRDVTERLRAERELKVASDRLTVSERLASLGVLAAGVAHEINNPLAWVIANVRVAEVMLGEIAPGGLPGADQAREALRDAADGAERVRRIVAELKTFSRPDDETRGPVDLRRVLESALAMARYEVKHRARVVLSLPPEPLAVDANAARLGQVFLNLLVNAAQAIPEGHVDRNEIRVTGALDAGRVRVDVSDSGTGIPPEQLGRIFDPFFTTKPIGVGTGLGLAICHGIVSSLGGEIRAESAVGAGSTFTVILPAADPARLPAVPEAPALEEPLPTLRRGRILVIDDEPGIGAAIRRVLRRDHDVVAATSGREALSVIQSEADFDAVLCDVMMPELTGMELYRVLRAELPALAERVVFMSGGTFTAEAEAFLSEMPNRHIAKPFDPIALRAMVARLITRRGGGGASA
jgi:PAS domain S-box-containing protein